MVLFIVRSCGDIPKPIAEALPLLRVDVYVAEDVRVDPAGTAISIQPRACTPRTRRARKQVTSNSTDARAGD